jgi:hypothetical protein
MTAGWHGPPISDGSHDGPVWACAHPSILVFHGRGPGQSSPFCSAGVFLLPIKAVSGTLKADDRYSQAIVFYLVVPYSQLR